MSKYTPLVSHLATVAENDVRLSFLDIEEIIGRKLPASARRYSAWWSNSRTDDSHTWAHQWLKAGWEKRSVNFNEEWVEFRRVQYFNIDSKEALEGYERDR